MKGLYLALLALLLCAAPALCQPCQTCNLVKICDGDTIWVICPQADLINLKRKLRLSHIDAPETKQPGGPEATLHLAALLGAGSFSVCGDKKDMYGRDLSEIIVGNVNVNKQMVEDGFAWSYKHQDKEYNALETEAKSSGRGLWTDSNAQPPWEFRKEHRARALVNTWR